MLFIICQMYNLPMFRALRTGRITLTLITNENRDEVYALFQPFSDADALLKEITEHYLPRFDENGRRTKYGFYATLDDQLAGLSLLGISKWGQLRGYTGADTLLHMRGKGVAPGSKPHLFYLGFEVLGLHRIETGCLVSNLASKRSIEKTSGFQFEGTSREFARNERGEFEDELRYAILRKDWLRLYDKNAVEVIR